MTRACQHERARFHAVQKLGQLPPVELWHCPACKSTVAKPGRAADRRKKTAAA